MLTGYWQLVSLVFVYMIPPENVIPERVIWHKLTLLWHKNLFWYKITTKMKKNHLFQYDISLVGDSNQVANVYFL